MIPIALTSVSLPAKKRILTVCVRLFLEKGYKKTTLAEIIEKADVSYSSFQNIFRAKDGVLNELVEFMFSSQFGAARRITGEKLRLFLMMSLKVYNVPEYETEQIVQFVGRLDIRSISEQVMQELFRELAMHFEFSLAGLEPGKKEENKFVKRRATE